ncbi:uncharacterized protein LAESUDRAFT_723041 [Laetiporus sulphureus 93-53]|uniref:Uncharacterized protein n=1 Tax=Laetiporus sulphureus 93-53 TaxID=1314785 RepID=A0A165FQ49_9APHY|nr:uncharacterized protein LAESUDRAFT_723041 [Laetiporus sulphureus 93-53]KZT09307.1 hypothetical protein LAESUDRAFT_723041 [Laetiporus sulphureus 93-53]
MSWCPCCRMRKRVMRLLSVDPASDDVVVCAPLDDRADVIDATQALWRMRSPQLEHRSIGIRIQAIL